MKNLVRALVLLMLAAAFVQSGVKAEAQTTAQKRVVTIDESTGELVDISQAQEAARPAASAPGIIILNNQKSTQGSGQVAGQVAGQVSGQKAAQSAIQDQPTNVIEDTPLSASAAERRRRERQGLEMQTEQKIVEKLEDARIEDEKARSERLFNKGFSSRDHKERDEAPAATPAPQQVQIIQAPAPVVAEKEQEPRVNVKEEIRAAFDEMNKKQAPATQYYIQGLTGIGQYPDAKNVTGNMALGFGVGMVTEDRIVAEGTFQYSQYDVKQVNGYSSYPGYGYDYSGSIPFTKATQYNFQAAMKYQILGGRVRPVVGAIAGYTYRSYEGSTGYGYGSYYGGGYSSTNSASTNAFDLGVLVGLDVQVTTTFSIGADFRYMKNVAYKGNGDYSNAYALQAPFKRLEEINYYLGSVVGKFTF